MLVYSLPDVNWGDIWVVVFLALVLKLPLAGLLVALWMAFRKHDALRPAVDVATLRMALCAYCGARISVGYDARAIHVEADRIAAHTGEPAFDIESRLVQGALARPYHYAEEPRFCPDCGEEAVWTPIEAIDLSPYAPTLRRPG